MKLDQWTLTGFADEISPDVTEQLDVIQSEGLRYIELRRASGKNALDLDDDEVNRLEQELAARGIRVSAIGSPIGKIQITDAFEPHFARFERALELAQRLNAPYVRLFSFFVPEGKAEGYRDEVLRRMTAMAERASSTGVVLVHENEKHIYGDVPSRCLDILESVGNDALRMAWDPANFVQCGVRPFTDGYDMLRPYIEYVHVKDAYLSTGQVTLPGEGDGELVATLRALHASGFTGFFSMEPHLKPEGRFEGLSGGERFVRALNAFKGLLEAEGVAWQ